MSAAPNPTNGIAALFSCSAGERSFEHESIRHGVFFHLVIEGLKGQAAYTNREVSFSSLADYVQKQVRIRAPIICSANVQQSPNMVASVSGVFILLKSKSAAVPGAEEFAEGWKHGFGLGRRSDIEKARDCYARARNLGHPLGKLALAQSRSTTRPSTTICRARRRLALKQFRCWKNGRPRTTNTHS